MRLRHAVVIAALIGTSVAIGATAEAAPSAQRTTPAEYWTAARRAEAVPRDLFLDERGLAYTRAADGSFEPYGHATPAETPAPTAAPERSASPQRGKPGSSSDTTPPSVTNLSPCAGNTIGSAQYFSADVSDPSGVKSVVFELRYPDGITTRQYSAYAGSGNEWHIGFSNFSNGTWGWRVIATDNVKGGGNTGTTPGEFQPFTVDVNYTGGVCGAVVEPPPDPTGVVADAAWTTDDTVKRSVGRIYFELPANKRQTRWNGYVCSGTAVTGTADAKAVIVTAAHCVYDDADKAFARNVLFIPDQDASGTSTDLDCTNDRYGCWAPTVAVVDSDYTTRTFPDNSPWDYAFYVVDDTNYVDDGTGTGTVTVEPRDLDGTVGGVPVTFAAPKQDPQDRHTFAIGYSYDKDPDLRYCAEGLGEFSNNTNWWLGSCDLSGGSSGGPWIQSADTDLTGDAVMSVNSWGYTTAPGMAGPKLVGTSASCLYAVAQGAVPAAAGSPMKEITPAGC